LLIVGPLLSDSLNTTMGVVWRFVAKFYEITQCTVDKKLCYRRRTARRVIVSRNLVNCCSTTVGTSCATNQRQIEVMELELCTSTDV